MPSKVFFAILFIGRQGSSFLEGLLDSHPDARCEGELLAPARRHRFAGKATGFQGYLEDYMYRQEKFAVGFKLPWHSLMEYPPIWDFLSRHNYRLIHLTRENLLDQYISMKLAQINNAWRSDKGTIRINNFSADFREVEESFRLWQGQNEILRYALKSFTSTHVTYEELLSGTGSETVLRFLDLPIVSLQSRFNRQRSGSQSEIVENYREMKSHFSGTEWAGFFVDTPALGERATPASRLVRPVHWLRDRIRASLGR